MPTPETTPDSSASSCSSPPLSPVNPSQIPPVPLCPLPPPLFCHPLTLTHPPPPFKLDGPIRANRFADSRESPDSCESFQGSQTEPHLLRIAFPGGGLRIANRYNRRFEVIRANRPDMMKVWVFLRIDSRE